MQRSLLIRSTGHFVIHAIGNTTGIKLCNGVMRLFE